MNGVLNGLDSRSRCTNAVFVSALGDENGGRSQHAAAPFPVASSGRKDARYQRPVIVVVVNVRVLIHEVPTKAIVHVAIAIIVHPVSGYFGLVFPQLSIELGVRFVDARIQHRHQRSHALTAPGPTNVFSWQTLLTISIGLAVVH